MVLAPSFPPQIHPPAMTNARRVFGVATAVAHVLFTFALAAVDVGVSGKSQRVNLSFQG